jgi:hypothetical protein
MNRIIRLEHTNINQRILVNERRDIVKIAPKRFLPVIQCPLKQKWFKPG